MILQRLRPPLVRNVVARLLLRAGVSPNTVTVVGTIGILVGAVGFASQGQLLTATVIVAISSLCDLLDGEMARISDRASRFGALLDSTLDRVADDAILASLAYWLFTNGDNRAAVAALLCFIAGELVPYVRARAEGLGLIGEAGVAHRFVRLKIIGVGALLEDFRVPYGLEIVLWFLAALSTVTVWQRLAFARRQVQEAADERG